MTLVQLSYIVSVANHKSFALAAKKSFVTQPTMSMQIRKLEEELGIIIFDRSRQPVIPTEIGRKIIDQARIILKESGRINDILDSESLEISGIFKLAVIPTVAPYLLPLFIEDFVSRHPGLNLIIDEIQTGEVIEKLFKDELDAAIVATPLNLSEIREEPIYFEPFVAYIARGHRLYGKEYIDAEDLSVDDLWLLKEGHCFRDHSIQICKNYEEEKTFEKEKISFESGALGTIKKLVEQNFGMTLLPYLAVNDIKDTNNERHLRYFNEPVPIREISIVFHRAHLKKKIIEALKSAILDVIPEELLNKRNRFLVG